MALNKHIMKNTTRLQELKKIYRHIGNSFDTNVFGTLLIMFLLLPLVIASFIFHHKLIDDIAGKKYSALIESSLIALNIVWFIFLVYKAFSLIISLLQVIFKL